MSRTHRNPESCMATMRFKYSDGGRAQFIEELEPPELPTGDCAVVAMVHAVNAPPTAGAYLRAIQDLKDRRIVLKRWKGRMRGESTSALLKRKLVSWLFPRDVGMNPIHETLTPVYDWLLEHYGYIHVFELDSGPQSPCICNPKRAYVVEGFTETQGGHVTAIWDHVIRGNYDASKRPFRITNIWMLPAAGKAAIEEQQQAEEEFLIQMGEWLAESREAPSKEA